MLFPEFRRELNEVAKIVLWNEFKKKNEVLVDECLSYILERLASIHDKIDHDKDRSVAYTLAKSFYLEQLLYKNNTRAIFFEDMLIKNDRKEDTFNFLMIEDKEDNLEELKAEAVSKFQMLIQKSDDKNSILTVCAIMECILTQCEYNAQFLSLFLYRKTNLSYDTLYRIMKRMKLNLAISRMDYFTKMFQNYSKIEPQLFDDTIISDWEKRAIIHFENKHERFKGENYEARHNRIMEKPKVKSTPIERLYWMKSYKGDNLEGDYYKAFGKAYRTFKSDKKAAFN